MIHHLHIHIPFLIIVDKALAHTLASYRVIIMEVVDIKVYIHDFQSLMSSNHIDLMEIKQKQMKSTCNFFFYCI
jgi:hypothetical protein